MCALISNRRSQNRNVHVRRTNDTDTRMIDGVVFTVFYTVKSCAQQFLINSFFRSRTQCSCRLLGYVVASGFEFDICLCACTCAFVRLQFARSTRSKCIAGERYGVRSDTFITTQASRYMPRKQ